MDLFVDGAFVRLRSRAWDKYVHADEDESGVSLRPFGAVNSRNVAWVVRLWPGQGLRFATVPDADADFVLVLHSVASGKCLAASDELAPYGHRGVRALQRDLQPLLDHTFMWLAVRVEDGQNYVNFHNAEGFGHLRANGRHRRHCNNLVTLDACNDSRSTMKQWTVEAIIPEPLPRRPSPQPPSSCFACGREGSGGLCRRCAGRFVSTLLGVTKERLRESGQTHCYCLECHEFLTGSHTEHQDRRILVCTYKSELVAWVTGDEAWRSIFQGIETLDRDIKPYVLRKSKWARCHVCGDIVSKDDPYGSTERHFCSIKCFVTGARNQEMTMEAAMVETQYSPDTTGFCFSCAAVTRLAEGESHSGHDSVRVRTEAGLRPRVLLPHGHPKEKTWEIIRKEVDLKDPADKEVPIRGGQPDQEILIRDDDSVRCVCGKRLSVGHSCSYECSLDSCK